MTPKCILWQTKKTQMKCCMMQHFIWDCIACQDKKNNLQRKNHNCLFDLILYVPSTIFQLNRDGSSWVEPVLSLDKCFLLKDHNAVTPVRLKPPALLSRVKHSTTEPLRSLKHNFIWIITCDLLIYTTDHPKPEGRIH